MEKTLTLKQAYKAMFVFVKNYYNRKGKTDELGILLGDIQLLSYLLDDPEKEGDETSLYTADPASWGDWLEAVETVLQEENESRGA
ncbi:MAG: hypothetical protein ACE5E7_12990 [Anaerolineae bacterium]